MEPFGTEKADSLNLTRVPKLKGTGLRGERYHFTGRPLERYPFTGCESPRTVP